MNIHLLQHVSFEGLGMITGYLDKSGHTLTRTRLFEDEELPDTTNVDALIVMGGPMSVHDEAVYPWLAPEKAFIQESISQNKPVLGICLGAQLIAEVLGANVYPGPEKEIGWFPVELTDESTIVPFTSTWPECPFVFHWHSETFDLPKGAICLASSTACTNQAFLYEDSVIGLQFHLEMELQDIQRIIQHCRHEIITGPYIQPENDMIRYIHHVETTHPMMKSLLDYWFDLKNPDNLSNN